MPFSLCGPSKDGRCKRAIHTEARLRMYGTKREESDQKLKKPTRNMEKRRAILLQLLPIPSFVCVRYKGHNAKCSSSHQKSITRSKNKTHTKLYQPNHF